MDELIFIIDTSAILSGVPLNLGTAQMVTSTGITSELHPGGRDYRTFQFLRQKGLELHSPSKASLKYVRSIAAKTGDEKRLSTIDLEILALAWDLQKKVNTRAIILTDDYAMQNVAHTLNILFEPVSQKKITKKFKWSCRCPGCKRRFKDFVAVCPICGTETKTVISDQKDISCD